MKMVEMVKKAGIGGECRTSDELAPINTVKYWELFLKEYGLFRIIQAL